MSKGAGEPLVLVPGLMCDAGVFLPQVLALSDRFTVTVSAPVQGERIEEIASAMLGLLPQRFALFGYGFGGAMALELIRRAPERVTRLALLSTTPLAATPQEAAEIDTRIVAVRAGRSMDAWALDYPADGLAPGPYRADVLQDMRDMAGRLGPEVHLAQLRATQRRKDQQSVLRRIRQPSLILCGAHDTVTPVKRHEFMAEMIEYAEFRVIDDAGHVPSLETPEAVTDAIRDWMVQPLVLR